jgi:tRNA-dihydrouridine synthase
MSPVMAKNPSFFKNSDLSTRKTHFFARQKENPMKYYFAPLEGITGFDFRNVHHAMFKGIDSYFTPFLSARQTLSFVTKEKKDIAPENNIGLTVVPQILANKAPEFVWAAKEIQAHGYQTVNFNLGCPMPTVVTKKKGSGLLADLTHLESLLDDIFDGVANGGPQISIKTRLGFDNLEQACAIVELYNKYPLTELIIHPRSQKDLYKNPVNLDVFEACLTCTKHNVCYNGDIGAGNARKARNFAARAHSHFRNESVFRRFEGKKRHRQADFIVEISRCFRRFIFFGEYRGDEFLRRCFAYRARYAYREGIEKGIVIFCKSAERRACVAHENLRYIFRLRL